jgi:5'-nucleotidase (lipoprotein e(P4) family)
MQVSLPIGLLARDRDISRGCVHVRGRAGTSIQQLVIDDADAAADIEHRRFGDALGSNTIEQESSALAWPRAAVAAQLACCHVASKLLADPLTLMTAHRYLRASSSRFVMRRLSPLVALALVGCASRTASSPAARPPAPAAEAMPTAIHWTRNSAENRALLIQIYRGAEEQLARLAQGRPTGGWAVILDADETVLDNSTYQKERAAVDSGFTADSWNAWVRRASATALPGAGEFIRRARSLGGRVVIVTNRDEVTCEETRANFRSLGITVDAVLCRPLGSSDKNPRFQGVEAGTTTAGLPALPVLMWVGDNIQDFPRLAQSIRTMPDSAFAQFGRRYIVLPNPMYGSWEANERR